MSEKAKKQASSLSFTISQWFERISTMRPSTMLITIVVLGFAIFLFGGGIYDIVNKPLPAVYYNSKFYFLYPSLSDQFIFDTVVSGILFLFGTIGLLTVYQSSKHAYSPRQAYMTLIVGAMLLLLAYVFLEYFIYIKFVGA
jgi:hypothetical protein